MLAAILAAAAVAAAGEPAPSPAAPPATTAAAASVAATGAPSAAKTATGDVAPIASMSSADQLRELQLIYTQSCEVRAYGSFDDACSTMRQQIREAEKAARKEERASRR